MVLTSKPKLYDSGDVCDNIEETPSFSQRLPECEDDQNEDVSYVCEDYEGKYIEVDNSKMTKRKK